MNKIKRLLRFIGVLPKELNFENRLGEKELDFIARHKLPIPLRQMSSDQ